MPRRHGVRPHALQPNPPVGGDDPGRIPHRFLDARIVRCVVERAVDRRHLVQVLLRRRGGPADQRIPGRGSLGSGQQTGGPFRLRWHPCPSPAGSRSALRSPRPPRAKASPAVPVRAYPVSSRRPSATARLAACRSSAVPKPRRCRSGRTAMSRNPRCLLSRAGSSSRYQPADPGRVRQQPGLPRFADPAGRQQHAEHPRATSPVRPDRRPSWSRGRSRSRHPPAARPAPRTARSSCPQRTALARTPPPNIGPAAPPVRRGASCRSSSRSRSRSRPG